ncbi:MAG: hypothetical protein ACXVIJ_02060 [Thermoanaerobaculia bacterium]
MSENTPTNTGFGTTTGSDRGIDEVCPTCGQSRNTGLDQFLGRLGINEETLKTLKSQMHNVDVEQYLNSARDYLKNGSDKATVYAKENPGKVAAGVAALAVGAGLLLSSLKRD